MKNFKTHLAVFLSLATLLLAVGCTNKVADTAAAERVGADREIYSLRPQSDEFIAIIKLQGVPLLQRVVKGQDGSSSIPPEAVAELNAEQQLFLQLLHKHISEDIKVIYTYKYVINGFAVLAPRSVEAQLKALTNVAYVEWSSTIARPTFSNPHLGQSNEDYSDANSVKWIGSEAVHQLTAIAKDGASVAIRGKGVKVGIIDTGIDYTHSMLGGAGSAELYKSIDPSKPSEAFPNAKTVGGIDLVGTAYDSASGDFSKHIPLPDLNPLDEGGHGSHVAGTVAGLGDGKSTYSGVAPDADLYAIKVFGKDGSTSDSVIIAALEYAANPENRQDGSLAPLDVVNLSLGGGFGNPKSLYDEAVRNLSSAGTVVVCAAGNSGAVDYIVGAPSTSDEAISVAASIDNARHNWQFGAVRFSSAAFGEALAEAVESAVTKPIKEAGDVRGELVYLGIGNEELSEATKASVKGKVALFDRGAINFGEKIKRGYELGAIGVVVANNVPGNAFTMGGGEEKFDIPAIMITMNLGSQIKTALEAGTSVSLAFLTDAKIEKPELIDTLTDFSSKGPRSVDAAIKPEIAAPGNDVVSAAMGAGTKGVKFSGTSMATPHMAGVFALLRQYRPELSPADLKSLVMNTSKVVVNADKAVYPVSLQGAGRVQALEAAQSKLVFVKPSLSLGLLNLSTKRTARQILGIKNVSDQDLTLHLELANAQGLKLLRNPTVAVAAKQTVQVILDFVIDSKDVKEGVTELDGHVVVKGDSLTYTVPVLGVVSKISDVQATDLIVASSSASDSAGAAAQVTLENKGAHAGSVWLFNLLARDERKQDRFASGLLKACDLQAAGYRLLDKEVMGEKTKALQIAFKLYNPMTTWNNCEVNVQLDADGDNVADQELAGSPLETLGAQVPGLPGVMFSVLLDAGEARKLRAQYESDTKAGQESKVVFANAIQGLSVMAVADRSTMAVLEVDTRKLAKNAKGTLSVKVSTSFGETSSVEMDDFLENNVNQWTEISLDTQSQSFVGLPEVLKLDPGQKGYLPLIKGQGKSSLLVLTPENAFTLSDKDTDAQSKILRPVFKAAP